MRENDSRFKHAREAAQRLVDAIRASSPDATGDVMVEVTAIALGMLVAEADFPDLPEDLMGRTGTLIAFGLHVARLQRMVREKESCKGVA
jgi:hypothetical protein